MMDSYSDFARFYESLMEDARYPERADYLLSLCAGFNHETGLCLDLACGTGSLTRELQLRGVNVFGVDGSEDMLCEAIRGDGILYICQDMRELELACTMDPSNLEYQKAKEMFNTAGSRYGSTYYGDGGRRYRSSSDEACDCCMNLICLDCLCECLGGDLIRCI